MTLPELLKKTVEMQGSDLHITISTPPQVRVHGHLQRLEGAELTPSDTKALTYSVLTDAQKKRFEESLELDFSFGIKGLARFRCNMFNQREVHSDTHGFANALRAALREDPDIVLIGELRDLETIESALRIAETGHLTFATLHTNSAAQTINRIIDVFPAHQQGQIRTQLSLELEGIVCQALLPRADGTGRVISLEILIPTPAIRNLIRDDKVHQIYSTMQTGQEKFGMQTMNQSLATLYQRRLISLDTAMSASSMKDELEQMISRGAGVVAGAGMARPGAGLPPRAAR
jgi:twitching motility protein PilT